MHDGRLDRDLDLRTKLGADLDAIRAAFVRTIWTPTRGVSDPARRACADPDAREAGSLTPLASTHPLFSGRPGRQKAPADKDTDIGASIGSCEASLPRGTVGRRSTVRLCHDDTDGRWGCWPAGYRSPSSAPLCRDLAADGSLQEKREDASERARLDEICG